MKIKCKECNRDMVKKEFLGGDLAKVYNKSPEHLLICKKCGKSFPVSSFLSKSSKETNG